MRPVGRPATSWVGCGDDERTVVTLAEVRLRPIRPILFAKGLAVFPRGGLAIRAEI